MVAAVLQGAVDWLALACTRPHKGHTAVHQSVRIQVAPGRGTRNELVEQMYTGTWHKRGGVLPCWAGARVDLGVDTSVAVASGWWVEVRDPPWRMDPIWLASRPGRLLLASIRYHMRECVNMACTFQDMAAESEATHRRVGKEERKERNGEREMQDAHVCR